MPEKIQVRKQGDIIRAVNEAYSAYLEGMPDGEYSMELSRPRNAKFHAKFFSLCRYLFEFFEPQEQPEGKYGKPEKEFNKFRSDITIAAGYYNPVYNLKGELQLVARSISFANMEQDEFEKLYSAVINVGLSNSYIRLAGDESAIRAAVDRICSYG